jgi:hypothetical protein
MIVPQEGLLYGVVIPGLDRVAKGDGFCHGCLPHQQSFSARRNLWARQPVAEGGGWSSDQHCRGADSLLANEFHYFLGRARGSLVEVETRLMIAQNLAYFALEHGKQLFDKANELGKY